MCDNTSRGPLGSVMVIRTSNRLLASIAAGPLILTLLVDPLVQALFLLPNRLTINGLRRVVLQSGVFQDNDPGPCGAPGSQVELVSILVSVLQYLSIVLNSTLPSIVTLVGVQGIKQSCIVHLSSSRLFKYQ